MNRHLRRRLRTRRDQEIEKVAREIVGGRDANDLKSELARINTLSTLVTASDASQSRQWLWPAVVAVVCVTVAGILWNVPVSRTDVSAAIDSESLQLTLADTWRMDNTFRSPLMHFERLSTIHAPNLGISIEESTGDAWIELEGGEIALQSLELKDQALVEIQSDDDEVNLFASREPLNGTATALGKVTVSAGPRLGEVSVHHSLHIEIPETIEFSASDPKDVPTHFSIHKPTKWTLPRFHCRNISFVEEEVSGAAERTFSSGIKSGTVRFNDTSWPPLEFRERDLLRFDGTESARFDARSNDGLMHITLNGPVGSATIGEVEGKKELAPSYLEYLYSRKSLAFFWSAIVFLWGLIWSVRKTIFR